MPNIRYLSSPSGCTLRLTFHPAMILVTSAIVKIFLGGLRPHFLVRCAPDTARIATATRYGYGGIYYDTTVLPFSPPPSCFIPVLPGPYPFFLFVFPSMFFFPFLLQICSNSQWEVNDAQSAFPSAHSALASGGLNYLSLYLNGKFKVFLSLAFFFLICVLCLTSLSSLSSISPKLTKLILSFTKHLLTSNQVFQHQGHLLVYVLITASSFGSILIGFTRVVDYHHTFYNVMMGWTMGFLVSLE